MVRLGLFLTLLLLSCRLAATPSGEKVSWMRADLPPQWILDGELADQGWGDVQMRGLFPQLPGYDHQVIQGSLSRIWYEIEHRDGVCFTGAARNAERETFAVFSHRAIVVPAYGVTVRAHDVARFARALDEDRVIDLDKLGEDDKLTGGYTASREHFPAINLLHAGRLDFIFAEPVEAPYYKARFHLSSEFITLPIKGNAPSIKGYVVCSNGPIGRALITQLDLLLDQDDAWARFLRPLRRWMTAKDFAKALAQKPE
jgi:hypothetical protein